MTKTFTQDDVIRYLYDEIPGNEKSEFESALIFDDSLLGLLNELSSVKNYLSMECENPSNQTIKNILDYAKWLNLHGCSEGSDSRPS